LAVVVMMVTVLALTACPPAYGLLAVMLLTSRVVPVDIIDLRLPIGGGFKLADLVLLGTLIVVSCRELVARRLLVPCWPVTLPLLTFLGLGAMSVVYSFFLQG